MVQGLDEYISAHESQLIVNPYISLHHADACMHAARKKVVKIERSI